MSSGTTGSWSRLRNNQTIRNWSLNFNLLPPPMTAGMITALVKSCHRFVGRTSLNLHEVSTVVAAFRAPLVGRIDVFPSSSAAQNIVYLLQLWVNPRRHLWTKFVNVWASGAVHVIAIFALVDRHDVCAVRTKQHHVLTVWPVATQFLETLSSTDSTWICSTDYSTWEEKRNQSTKPIQGFI
jgi:hypothetical protein